MTVKCSFDATKNKHDCFREIDCIEKLCKKLKDHAMEFIIYVKKEIIPLTDKEHKSYGKKNACQICKKEFCFNENEKNKFKLYQKISDHFHYTGKFRGAAHSICNLKFKVPKEIPVVLHNSLTYDCHFTELAKIFKGQFECLEENTEKYITFSVPVKKEHGNRKTTTQKLKFFDSYRFMQSKLSDLVDNLSGIYIKECKSCMERKDNQIRMWFYQVQKY